MDAGCLMFALVEGVALVQGILANLLKRRKIHCFLSHKALG
jgi:hypothetical protein